jgi:hypothetical protein
MRRHLRQAQLAENQAHEVAARFAVLRVLHRHAGHPPLVELPIGREPGQGFLFEWVFSDVHGQTRSNCFGYNSLQVDWGVPVGAIASVGTPGLFAFCGG